MGEQFLATELKYLAKVNVQFCIVNLIFKKILIHVFVKGKGGGEEWSAEKALDWKPVLLNYIVHFEHWSAV